MLPARTEHDILIVGGGPAGATAALHAARHGLRAVLLESATHPRFHIGESLLPRNFQLFGELGLTGRLQRLPHTRKLGGSFVMGNDRQITDYHFSNALSAAVTETLNIERSQLDTMLVQAARDAGADVREGVTVRAVTRLTDGDVAVDTDRGPVTGRYLIDASGQNTVVGRHLKTRATLPDLQRVAYFSHLTGVTWRTGDLAGYPIVVMCEEGWFWLIPLDGHRVSVGLVLGADVARASGVPAREMLAWGIARCPLVRDLTRHATIPEANHVTADFSYTCRPYAGPGYFLVGDAATFVDPIFSTGVCMGMMSAIRAVDGVRRLARSRSPRRVRENYIRFVDGSSSVFFRLVRAFYTHEFRELFLHGHGPFQMSRAVTTVLTGHVFPRPTFDVRWRLWVFERFMRLQRLVPLVPRRQRFSLLGGA